VYNNKWKNNNDSLRHHFFDPLQNNAPKKEGANCAIITKDTKPMETNVYLKQNFIDGISQNNE
jgi:hypothetical protein